jgi:hypothetical protein
VGRRGQWLFALHVHGTTLCNVGTWIEPADRPFRAANGVSAVGRRTVLPSRRTTERRRRC